MKQVQEEHTKPQVSVALPVYNGERWLDGAIQSILSQTFTDLELIICDNASTDRTSEICQYWARQDARVQYHRNATNIGLMPNHNLGFHLSRGEYFVWFSYDDLHLPESIELLVRYLRENPDVALVYSAADTIDASGKIIKRDFQPIKVDVDSPKERFEIFTKSFPPEESVFYGLFRRDVLAQTLLLRNCHGADGCLLAEIALLARMHKLPTVLFQRRLHDKNMVTSQEEPWRFRPELSGKVIFPQWRLLAEDMRTIIRSDHALSLRMQLFMAVIGRGWKRLAYLKSELGFAWYHFKQRLGGNNITLSPADRAAKFLRPAKLPANVMAIPEQTRGNTIDMLIVVMVLTESLALFCWP